MASWRGPESSSKEGLSSTAARSCDGAEAAAACASPRARWGRPQRSSRERHWQALVAAAEKSLAEPNQLAGLAAEREAEAGSPRADEIAEGEAAADAAAGRSAPTLRCCDPLLSGVPLGAWFRTWAAR